jgi:hypothetical protein
MGGGYQAQQGGMGGGYQAQQGGMGSGMRGGTPPLDAAALSQVSLAGFGLGGLGNGEGIAGGWQAEWLVLHVPPAGRRALCSALSTSFLLSPSPPLLPQA